VAESRLHDPQVVPALTLELTSPDTFGKPVFISGNFNDWAAGDERYRMMPAGEQHYVFHFPAGAKLPAPFEYKYTLGNWDSEELDAAGNPLRNRLLQRPQGRFCDRVPRWRREGLSYKSELLPHRVLVDEFFPLSPLRRHRRVQALLPWDYHSSQRRYPVLYLHDGQNLFDELAPYGNWALDRQMAFLAERGLGDFIIVTVDHGGEERIVEYNPYAHPRFGKGKGKQYARFKSSILKPRIDKLYRSLPGRRFTGIGGSSLGGLISLYTSIEHAGVFGRAMVFSPSLWVSPQIYEDVQRAGLPADSRFYLYGGGAESRDMLPSLRRLSQLLTQAGRQEGGAAVALSTDPLGRHQEARWGEEFPHAVEWMFFS
jgi:predicted alpha/beta superfamily hydrolase